MSEGQKRRKYGTGASKGSRPAAPAKPIPAMPAPADRAPGSRRSTAGIMVGAITVIALLLVVYLHAVVLPSIGRQAHIVVPEFQPFGIANDPGGLAESLGSRGRSEYAAVHWSWGVIAPLFLTGAWVAFIARSLPSGRLRWAAWAAPLAFLPVFIAGNIAVDVALSHPGGPAGGLAAALLVLRWILLLIMAAEAVWLAVRLVRGKVDAFSRGELEGQQPVN